MQIDPGLELDGLRQKFDFEIISEQEDGYVIVASENRDLSKLQGMIIAFSTDAHGSATIASIHSIVDDPNQSERLQRILSESLYAMWPSLQDTQNYTYDVGIGGVGIHEIPNVPNRGKRDTDATWANKEAEWSRQRNETYQAWDSIKIEREAEIIDFVNTYSGRIITMVDDETTNAVHLPDSFTVRLELTGRGLRDLILNYPYIFEVIEPEDMEAPQSIAGQQAGMKADVTILPPTDTAPTVCVIDSGIQEEHMLLAPAIDSDNSYCFLPGMPSNQVGDHVKPDGHGTRVTGAVLYGESIPAIGEHTSVCWIQNARVLDDNCMM